jgi:DNA-binding transcriptional ArsR family regulator
VTCGSARFAEAIDTQQPTVSQQLRVLRQLGLVISKRRGRLIFHSLYDGHVSARWKRPPTYHFEHVRLVRRHLVK